MPPHLPGQAREREGDRERALGALRARLHDDAQALRTPGDWGACLGLATRLPGEDFANILLIHAQRPGATLVQDYRQWTAAGRQVRKGEHDIAIFATPPRPRAQRQDQDQDEPGPAWREADRVTYIWDLSQTTGPPLSDDAARPSRDPPAGVWDALCWLARRQGYAVELEHGQARQLRCGAALTAPPVTVAACHHVQRAPSWACSITRPAPTGSTNSPRPCAHWNASGPARPSMSCPAPSSPNSL